MTRMSYPSSPRLSAAIYDRVAVLHVVDTEIRRGSDKGPEAEAQGTQNLAVIQRHAKYSQECGELWGVNDNS